jgi:DNA mismatch endonuclease (patch repair protein)
MADTVAPAIRSRMMGGIKSKNTGPELSVRKALHHRGLRYRLHAKELPGKPDIVLPRYRAAVFVHGCFWHGHNCPLFKLPGTRPEFWRAKIERNQVNDAKSTRALLASGWRVAVIWECAVRGNEHIGELAQTLKDWVTNGQAEETVEIRR